MKKRLIVIAVAVVAILVIAYFVVVLAALLKVAFQFLQGACLGGSELEYAGIHVVDAAGETLDVGQQVFASDSLDGERRHAVHVNQTLKRSLLRGKEPVDGTVLVSFLVVGVEILGEIGLKVFAQGFLQEVHVGGVLFFAEDEFDEFRHACGCAVGEAAVEWHERDDAVVVDGEGGEGWVMGDG